jgi:hypothetical protein
MRDFFRAVCRKSNFSRICGFFRPLCPGTWSRGIFFEMRLKSGDASQGWGLQNPAFAAIPNQKNRALKRTPCVWMEKFFSHDAMG